MESDFTTLVDNLYGTVGTAGGAGGPAVAALPVGPVAVPQVAAVVPPMAPLGAPLGQLAPHALGPTAPIAQSVRDVRHAVSVWFKSMCTPTIMMYVIGGLLFVIMCLIATRGGGPGGAAAAPAIAHYTGPAAGYYESMMDGPAGGPTGHAGPTGLTAKPPPAPPVIREPQWAPQGPQAPPVISREGSREPLHQRANPSGPTRRPTRFTVAGPIPTTDDDDDEYGVGNKLSADNDNSIMDFLARREAVTKTLEAKE